MRPQDWSRNLGRTENALWSNSLFLSLILLMGIGLVQVYSSSYIFASETYDNGLFFFNRQLIFSLLGIVTLVTVASIPLELIRKYGWLLWILSGLAIALTLIPGVGVRVGGAARWLQLPFGIRVEPSEVLKLSFGLWVATFFLNERKMKLGLFVALTLAPLIMLLKQPDFGSFALTLIVTLSLLVAFGLKWRWIVAGVLTAAPLFYYLVMMVPYRKARVLAYLDPWADPEQKGFQLIQSMLSFHSGGLTGQGLGSGQGKLFFLPEAHTDFTLAVFGEEMGFIGYVLLLSIYLFILFRSFQIAIRVEDKFYKIVALSAATFFGLGVFINSGVVMGLLPTKGLTLPFMSYGGSSLVTLCFTFGLLLNIERRQKENPFRNVRI